MNNLTDRRGVSGSIGKPVAVVPGGPPTDREWFLYNGGQLSGQLGEPLYITPLSTVVGG